MTPMPMPRRAHNPLATLLALVAWLPAAAAALELDDVAREGELRFLAVRPDPVALAGLEIGLVGPQPAGSDTAFEVRAFFPGLQVLAEDPVTGSLNAAVAQWLMGAGLAPANYIASQGTAINRAGRVHLERDADGTIWVGGASVTCIAGEVTL